MKGERVKQLLSRLSEPGTIWWVTIVCLLFILGTGWLARQIELRIREARTVTQAQVEEGWQAAGLELIEHTIRRGENFWKVAKRYGVDIDTIIGANRGLTKLLASTGQIIRVPCRKGALHVVQEDEDIHALSESYGVPLEVIRSVNTIQDTHILPPGLELFIPGVRPQQLTPEMAAHFSKRGIFGSPLLGRITSTMGMRRHPVGGFRGKHTGVDLAAPKGSRIAAAAAGRVREAGEGSAIGKYVVLEHTNAYTTLYGHCSRILVKQGQKVKRGQIIARVGSTGRSTGPHLHFEIRKSGIPRDPLRFLW